MNTSYSRRTIRQDRDHFDRLFAEEVQTPHEPARDEGDCRMNTQRQSAHLAVGQQFTRHPPGGVTRHSESQTLREGNNRGVHSDEAAARIDQRAARIPGVEWRRMLNNVLDKTSLAAPHRAAESTDDTG